DVHELEPDPIALVDRHQERGRPDQVRRDHGLDPPLAHALEHQPELALLEVAQPAVHQLGRLGRGPGTEVRLLEQEDLEAAQRRVARDPGAGDAAADDDEVVGGPVHVGLPPAAGGTVTWMNSSSSWRRSTGVGASVMRSVPFWVLGKAITSRSDSAPHRSMVNRSTPNAIPPCGGGPYLNASSRKPNLARKSSSVSPSAANTLACTSRW